MDATARKLSTRLAHHATDTITGSGAVAAYTDAVTGATPLVQPFIAVSWSNASGGDWSVMGNWSPNSVPNSTSAVTIGLAGNYTVTVSKAEAANSLTMTDAGATLSLTSTLTIGTTFSITAGTLVLNPGGVLAGGTLAIGSAGAAEAVGGGALSGVAVQGTLGLSGGGFTFYLENGVTFAGVGGTGTGTINFVGGRNNYNYLSVVGSNTLSNATLNIGADGNGYNYLYNQHVAGGSTLTLASSFVIVQADFYAAIGGSDGAGDAIVNNGTIDAAYAGGEFQIDATHFTNNGSIIVSGGDAVVLDNTVSTTLVDSIQTTSGGELVIGGTLNNTGNTITVGPGGSLGVSGVVSGGTISAPVYGYGGAGTLSGVAVQGTLAVFSNSGSYSFTLENGVTFAGVGGTGTGTINFVGGRNNYNYLSVVGSNTLSNATLNIGADGNGYNYLYNDDTTGRGATLTLAASFSVVQADTDAAIGGSSNAHDAVIN